MESWKLEPQGLGQLERKGDPGEIRRGRWRQKPSSSYKTCCWNIPTHEPKTKHLSLAFTSLMPLQDGFLPLLTEKVASQTQTTPAVLSSRRALRPHTYTRLLLPHTWHSCPLPLLYNPLPGFRPSWVIWSLEYLKGPHLTPVRQLIPIHPMCCQES